LAKEELIQRIEDSNLREMDYEALIEVLLQLEREQTQRFLKRIRDRKKID
jgi:hypothetical protein